MLKTFRLSFTLKNTYRVNAILYAIRQIPLLRRVLPSSLHRVRGLKYLAYVLAALWEVVSTFAGKLIYYLLMVTAMARLYTAVAPQDAFLHILLLLTIIGGFLNTNLFNPTKDKFYAVILMRMDAQAYTRVNYGYAMIKVIVGTLPWSIVFGRVMGLALWLCLLLPFSVAGWKMAVAASSLWDYERRGLVYNENQLGKWLWGAVGALGLLAYVPPALGYALPWPVSAALLGLAIPAGAAGAVKIWRFTDYRAIYQQLSAQSRNQMDAAKTAAKRQVEKSISADRTITSRREGFEYLNELFIKRHRKILWSAAEKVATGCLAALGLVLIVLIVRPGSRAVVNGMMLTYLPYFVFLMYCINRGTGFTRALFMNCDHSLLTYSFYKQPRMILRLFAIRLREIIKINLLPAAVIGGGLALLLYCSGGTDNPLHYVVIVVSILSMSVFFSVHYLTIYYLLQPYNAATEIKSGTYQLITLVTYVVCYAMIRVQLPTMLFGTACILFCLLYCLVACLLVYRLAPRTFRLRT